ncbi:hypothetical protein WJX73_003616 [Symbiochloris irregularis]|uniref:Uncharacterized protein n=1 Tax=Symbiochloris irregularis TaxID=706552 RepID=A0AAW1P0H6_9CHLO
MDTCSSAAVSHTVHDSKVPLHEAMPACIADSAEQILRQELESAALNMEQHQRMLCNEDLEAKAQVLRETNQAVAKVSSLQGDLAHQVQCMTGAKLAVGIDGQTLLLELLAAATSPAVDAKHLASVTAYQDSPEVWASMTQRAIEASSSCLDCSTGLDNLLSNLRKLRKQLPHA